MRSIKQDDWMIEFDEVNVDHITDTINRSWHGREQRRQELRPITAVEKDKAKQACHAGQRSAWVT